MDKNCASVGTLVVRCIFRHTRASHVQSRRQKNIKWRRQAAELHGIHMTSGISSRSIVSLTIPWFMADRYPRGIQWWRMTSCRQTHGHLRSKLPATRSSIQHEPTNSLWGFKVERWNGDGSEGEWKRVACVLPKRRRLGSRMEYDASLCEVTCNPALPVSRY